MVVVDASTCSTSATASCITNVPQTVEVRGKLPSELYRRHHGTLVAGKQGDVDAESVMQRILSALATQEDLGLLLKGIGEEESIPSRMWRWLTESEEAKDDANCSALPSDDSQYEWYMGVRLVHYLLPLMSPFEIHAVANQAIVFTDGSMAHCSLCLLLCVYALLSSPHESPIVVRWKRWQSLLFETIRLYQHYGLDLVDLAGPLWVFHILPACRQLAGRLPGDAHHVAFLAAIVGTTSSLVVRECQCLQTVNHVEKSDGVSLRVIPLVDVTRTILHEVGGLTEDWLWSNPWRSRSGAYNGLGDRDEEVEFIRGRDDIVWWTQVAYRHESVAGVDTSWDGLGISLMAFVAFDSRPIVLSTSYVWSTWLPHVRSLFDSMSRIPSLAHLPLSLLEKLVRVVPKQSLPLTKTNSKLPDSPYVTFQHLSNRLLVRQRGTGSGESDIDDDVAVDNTIGVRTQKQTSNEPVVSLMKSLLNVYQPVNQVKMIRRLVHDSPYPGLQALFIDFLRSLIFDEAAAEPLWTYIGSFMKDMTAHVDIEKGILREVDTLVQKVEIYVAASTMIQLWCMVKHRLPRKIKGRMLHEFFDILQSTLSRWLSDTMAMPPDEYYRLYLLEGALQQVIRVLDDASGRKSNDKIEVGESLSDDDDANTGFPSSSDQSPPPTKPVIVGDAKLFA